MVLDLENQTEQEISLGVRQHGMVCLTEMNAGHGLKQPVHFREGEQHPDDFSLNANRHCDGKRIALHLGIPLNVTDIDRTPTLVVGGLPPGLVAVLMTMGRVGRRDKSAFPIQQEELSIVSP